MALLPSEMTMKLKVKIRWNDLIKLFFIRFMDKEIKSELIKKITFEDKYGREC
jgi:hypothetical protein